MKSIIRSSVFLLFFVSKVCAIDIPQFYAVPAFNASSSLTQKSLATAFDFKIRTGTTRTAGNDQEGKVALFDGEGAFNIGQIVPYDPTVAGGATQSTLYVPTGDTLAFVNAMYAITDASSRRVTKNGSPFYFGGKFKNTDYVFEFQQNLPLGFFAGIDLCYRDMSITDIAYSTTIPTTDARYNSLIDLIDNKVDPMLVQNGMQALKNSFKRSAFSDTQVYLGWQGRNETKSDFIDYISGGVRGGALFPSGQVKDLGMVFSLPIGYNGHYGISARGFLEVGFFKWFALGVSGASSTFFRQLLERRVKIDAAQNGWILLNKANVLEDLGHLLEVSAYIKLYTKYISAMVGYSFEEQEATRLTISARDNPDTLYSDHIMNTDSRLTGWGYQTIHTVLRVDSSQFISSVCAPVAEFTYDMMLSAKHAFATNMVGGMIGCRLLWDF